MMQIKYTMIWLNKFAFILVPTLPGQAVSGGCGILALHAVAFSAPADPCEARGWVAIAQLVQAGLAGHVEPHGLLVVDVDALSGWHVTLVAWRGNSCYFDTNSNGKHAWMLSQREVCPTFLTSRVSMQRSMRSTVEMSMYSRHMSFIHLVKLSTVVSKSSQVNFIMLNTRLTILSEWGEMDKLI